MLRLFAGAFGIKPTATAGEEVIPIDDPTFNGGNTSGV
jgi:hypothetical protein